MPEQTSFSLDDASPCAHKPLRRRRTASRDIHELEGVFVRTDYGLVPIDPIFIPHNELGATTARARRSHWSVYLSLQVLMHRHRAGINHGS